MSAVPDRIRISFARANSVAVKTYTGYYNDTAVYFASFETNSSDFAAVNGIVFAPRLSQVNMSSLPRMIFFMNGTGRQTVVLETQPGNANYSPLWRVISAWWVGSDPMPLIVRAVMDDSLSFLLCCSTGRYRFDVRHRT